MPNLQAFLKTSEAMELLKREKFFEANEVYDFPLVGQCLSLEIFSKIPKRVPFILDISRKYLSLKKYTFQNRVKTDVVLARLDIGGRHRNPDDTEICAPHLHLYREGYEDKWAYPLSSDNFSNPEDVFLTLEQFMNYCNIIKKPIINPILF